MTGLFDEADNAKFFAFAKKYASSFKCTVTTQDGDLWVFHVPDIHSFCVQMYDYFSEKCDVFEVKVEREVQK